MSSVNKVILIGNLGKDPEIRTLNSGDRIASFSLATSERWTDKRSGEKKEKSEWHKVVIFNEGLVSVVERYVKKGSTIYVEGQLATRKWQGQNGEDRYATEVVLQKFRGAIQIIKSPGGREPGEDDDYTQRGGGSQAYSDQSNSYRDNPKESFPADLDDEIPF